MKKIAILLFIIFTMPVYAQWWVPQNSGVTTILNDVNCIDENIVVVVGYGGIILKTIDGGQNWVQKSSGTTADLMKVQFATPTTGYAVGTAGTLLKTADKGETWNTIATGETAGLYGLSVLNENILYISGENGIIKKSADGGISFSVQNTQDTETITNIQYLNELTGYAQNQQLLKTTDGGTTWSSTGYYSNNFYFLDENIGFIVADGGILKTIDGGLNYTGFGGIGGYMTNVFSLDPNIAWGVENSTPLCGCATHCIVKGNLMNAEADQSIRNCNFGEGDGIPFNAIRFASATKGYAVGYLGAIYKNTTGIMLGTEEMVTKEAFKIYPNPSSDQVTLSFGETQAQPFSIEITDSLGKRIYLRSYLAENTATVDVASFSKGLYFLTVVSNEKKQTQKIIVN